MADRQRIVILGSGFAGVNVAQHLVKRAKNNEEIILVSTSATHTFTPWLYEIATEKADECARLEKRCMSKTADIPLTFLGSRVKIKRAEVVGLDVLQSHVLLAAGQTLHYDSLVVALGSESAYFGIVGLQEHALGLKSTADALAIRRRIFDVVNCAKRGDCSEIKIVIAGAGPSGVELAAEMATMMNGLVRRRVLAQKTAVITLVDGGERVLGTMSTKISRLAEHRLRVLGVKILLQTRVHEVKANEVMVKVGNKIECLESDCMIWTGGVQPVSVLKNFALPKDPRGRILVEPTFEVAKTVNIFALGDAAAFVDITTKQVLPQTAQAAENAAPLVADNVLRGLRRIKLKPYKFIRKWPYSIAVGGNYALLGYGNMVLSGWIGYAVRRLVDLRYFWKILPVFGALKFWAKGVLEYRKND